MKVIIKKNIVSRITGDVLPKEAECKVQEKHQKKFLVFYNNKSWFVDKKDVKLKGDVDNVE